ncbi:MAG: lysophospholipid acyltransferase family protein [Burkholderiaceae bacterium]
MSGLRRLVRLPGLVGLLFGGLLTVFLVFPLVSQTRRDALVRRWSRMLLACCGVRVREVVRTGGEALADQGGGRMLLANHISWLDIFVIDAIAPASFVAKSEIARWPLAGTLVARVGTVFIERGRRRAVRDVITALCRRLEAGGRAAVFPEGTTTDGGRILPFFGNLAQAAIDAKAPVVPIGLRYVDPDGIPSHAAAFIGDDHFLDAVWRITGHPELIAEMHVLPAIDASGMTRHALAEQARLAISRSLDIALDDTLPAFYRDRAA